MAIDCRVKEQLIVKRRLIAMILFKYIYFKIFDFYLTNNDKLKINLSNYLC